MTFDNWRLHDTGDGWPNASDQKVIVFIQLRTDRHSDIQLHLRRLLL